MIDVNVFLMALGLAILTERLWSHGLDAGVWTWRGQRCVASFKQDSSLYSKMQCLKYAYDVAGALNGPCWLDFIGISHDSLKSRHQRFLNLVDVRRLAPAWRMIQSHQLADHAFPGALKSGGNTSVSYYLPYKGTVFIASTTQRCSPWCLINWSLYKDQCFGICKDCVLPSLTDQRKIYHRKLRNSVGSRPRVRQFENWSPHVFSFFQIETCSQNPRTSVHSTQLSFSNMCFSIAWCQTELNLNPAQWTEIKANVPFFWKLTSACWLW